MISWSIHFENGCVPAAAITRPFFAARSITMPRSRTISARASAGVWQTWVPTSTIDWCSSGLISRRIAESALSISVM
ncbi:MAG: hypothetical protein V9E87_06815 [Gemmatimonadales bacterium]